MNVRERKSQKYVCFVVIRYVSFFYLPEAHRISVCRWFSPRRTSHRDLALSHHLRQHEHHPPTSRYATCISDSAINGVVVGSLVGDYGGRGAPVACLQQGLMLINTRCKVRKSRLYRNTKNANPHPCARITIYLLNNVPFPRERLRSTFDSGGNKIRFPALLELVVVARLSERSPICT
jgi:hypothetical protein